MATSRSMSRAPDTGLRSSARNVAWMSARQLDAYLQARETLRRFSTKTPLIARAPRPASPPRGAHSPSSR